MAESGYLSDFLVRSKNVTRDLDIINGKVFTWQWVITCTTTVNRNILYVTSAASTMILVDPLLMDSNEGSVQVDFYLGHDYSGGSTTVIYNRNNSSTNVHKSVLTLDSTGSDKGTLAGSFVIGTVDTNQNGGGGAIQSVDTIIPNPDLPYLVDFTRLGSGTSKISILFTFIET